MMIRGGFYNTTKTQIRKGMAMTGLSRSALERSLVAWGATIHNGGIVPIRWWVDHGADDASIEEYNKFHGIVDEYNDLDISDILNAEDEKEYDKVLREEAWEDIQAQIDARYDADLQFLSFPDM